MPPTPLQSGVLMAMSCSTRPMIVVRGTAGTGKSSTMHAFADWLAADTRTALVCLTPTATAGQAAPPCNCGEGVDRRAYTLAEFVANKTMQKNIRRTFQRASTFDKCILMIDEYAACTAADFEKVLTVRKHIFHGIRVVHQLVMVGDHHQLPSVETSIFHSQMFDDFLQDTPTLLQLTEAVRCQGDYEMEQLFRAVVDRNMDVFLKLMRLRWYHRATPPEGYTCLAFTNERVDCMNNRLASSLAAEGNTRYILEATDGSTQTFVKHARVICTKNVRSPDGGYTIVNGAFGTLERINGEGRYSNDGSTKTIPMGNAKAHVRLDKTNTVVVVVATTCEDSTNKTLPLAHGWAVTIHKSQGMTLKHVYLDLEGATDFQCIGVAATRGTTFATMLVKPFDDEEINRIGMLPLPTATAAFDKATSSLFIN